jgi:hypothetical protein
MLLFLFVEAFLSLLVLTGGGERGGGGGGGGSAGDGDEKTWNARMVLSMETSTLAAAAGGKVLFGVAFGDLEGDLGRRGQTRRVNVVCERRKTRKSSTRRKGRDREKTSNGNGFRGGGAIAGGKKSDGAYVEAGGVAMSLFVASDCMYVRAMAAASKEPSN